MHIELNKRTNFYWTKQQYFKEFGLKIPTQNITNDKCSHLMFKLSSTCSHTRLKSLSPFLNVLSHVVSPSVCLSMTLVHHDHIGWRSWKLIAQAISTTSSLFVAKRSPTYSQGNMEKILYRLEVGWQKVACWSTKAAIYLKRVKIEEKLLWMAYRKSPTLFQFFRSLHFVHGHREGRFCLIFARTAQQWY